MVSVLLLGSAAGLHAQAAAPPAAAGAHPAPVSPGAPRPQPEPSHTKPPPTAAELQQSAVAQQRAAIRQQAETLGLRLMPLDVAPRTEPAEPPDCAPLEDSLAQPLIDQAAGAESLDPKLLRAVMEQESGFRPCAVSPKGALGLMQLMPQTAAGLGVADPLDPKQNVAAGARYLKQLIEKYRGDLRQALGAYNAGPNTVDQSGGVPGIEETREYVAAILAKAGIQQADTAAAPAKVPPSP